MTTQNKTQMGKLNQVLFLVDRSDTIQSCFINSEKEIFKLYFNNDMIKNCPFAEFKFNELDDTIGWLKGLIKAEVDTSYKLANKKPRDYIGYYD